MKELKEYKKHQFKQWFKKRKVLIIGTGSFLLVGLILLIVGFSLTGFNIIEWFKSPYFTTTVICIGGSLIILITILIFYKIRDLNDR